MAIPHLLRIGCLISLVAIAGCFVFQKTSLQYIGNSHEMDDAPTPNGFTISPAEAREIAELHQGPKISRDGYYHGESNYYVSDAFIKSKASTARKFGTVINGQTGEVYNSETKLWKADPRFEKEPQPE